MATKNEATGLVVNVHFPAMPIQHESGCPELRARTCSGAIECAHGYDCCPICDPCTCGARSLPKARR